MSFNSNTFSYWNSQTVKVSDHFTYKNKNYALTNPFRAGVSLGIRFKSKNEIIIGYHADGVSAKQTLLFPTYSPQLNTNFPNQSRSKSVSDQQRLFLIYNHMIFKPKNKTTLFVVPSISYMKRAGPSFPEPVGSFGSSALLPENYSIDYSYTGFTRAKYAIAYGIGIGSDIYIKEKYLCSTSIQFSYSENYLSSDLTKVKITNLNTGEELDYHFESYGWATGLYLTLTKKINIFDKDRIRNKNTKGRYEIPNRKAREFIESKQGTYNWNSHRNFKQDSIPQGLEKYFSSL